LRLSKFNCINLVSIKWGNHILHCLCV
jgi:hypothetical protein